MSENTEHQPHDALDVANEMLRMARKRDIAITPLKIAKLVYMANGWWLTLPQSEGQSFVRDDVEAWRYGPVYPRIYRAFSWFGARQITELAINREIGMPYTGRFSDEEIKFLEKIIDTYSKYDGWQLSKMTHDEDTPWAQEYRNGGNNVIPQKVIKGHFDGLWEIARTRQSEKTTSENKIA